MSKSMVKQNYTETFSLGAPGKRGPADMRRAYRLSRFFLNSVYLGGSY
jgi:hypothetical protein